MIASESESLVSLFALRPVIFDFVLAVGSFVTTALSLLTRGFRWLVFLGSGSTTAAAAAFVRALVVLVVVDAGVTRPVLVLVEALVAVVDLLAIDYRNKMNMGYGI